MPKTQQKPFDLTASKLKGFKDHKELARWLCEEIHNAEDVRTHIVDGCRSREGGPAGERGHREGAAVSYSDEQAVLGALKTAALNILDNGNDPLVFRAEWAERCSADDIPSQIASWRREAAIYASMVKSWDSPDRVNDTAWIRMKGLQAVADQMEYLWRKHRQDCVERIDTTGFCDWGPSPNG